MGQDLHLQIQKLEREMFELGQKLSGLRASAEPVPVKNYVFQSLMGDVRLDQLFAGKEKLLVIHNMGQGCRYCTLWADGFNGFLPHLESAMSVVLVSKDSPQLQKEFANSRGWRFQMASHGGRDYIQEQSVVPGQNNMPGAVVYEKLGSQIFKKNATSFGPGDQFCAMWPLLSLAGLGEDSWKPQFHYWKAPQKLDDGGD